MSFILNFNPDTHPDLCTFLSAQEHVPNFFSSNKCTNSISRFKIVTNLQIFLSTYSAEIFEEKAKR